VIEELL